MERTVLVVAPHFAAGLVISNETNKVIDAAPIIRWAIGRHVKDLNPYFNKKGWSVRR